jgi:hypothetical protein
VPGIGRHRDEHEQACAYYQRDTAQQHVGVTQALLALINKIFSTGKASTLSTIRASTASSTVPGRALPFGPEAIGWHGPAQQPGSFVDAQRLHKKLVRLPGNRQLGFAVGLNASGVAQPLR